MRFPQLNSSLWLRIQLAHTRRAQTTWSGTQTLTGTYTIGVADEVIIQPCTVVRLPANERIIVDGRLTVLGTQSCPVILEASGLGDHEGSSSTPPPRGAVPVTKPDD